MDADPNRLVEAELTRLPPGRALDLGCGEVCNAVWLAEHGWQVTRVDLSPVALEKRRGPANSRGAEVDWVRADVVTCPTEPRGFELVVVAHDLANLDGGVGGPREPDVLYTPRRSWPIWTGFGSTGLSGCVAPVGDGAAIDTLARATLYPGG